ncbi:MAG: hypothetical protein V4722_22065 [Bacteroidota bacterium]
MSAPFHITLQKMVVLKDFPSGSAMEFFDGNIYLMGDDARQVVVLDTAYEPLTYINLFASGEKRIPKIEKADIEASAIIEHNGFAHLLALGSASRALRERAFLLSLPANEASTFEIFDTRVFTQRLSDAGVSEVNIEGATSVGSQLLLSNRGNKNNPDNLLFVTSASYFLEQATTPLQIINIEMPFQDFPIGISALSFHAPTDILFFTASVEETTNAYDDGGIGDSYIGCIHNISRRLLHPTIKPDHLLNLAKADPVFVGQKVESICFENREANSLVAHLVSDNDNGESTLFKIQVAVPPGD